MKDLTIKNVLTDEELDARIEKLVAKNWRVKIIIRDCFDGQIEGVIHKFKLPEMQFLLDKINVKEILPGVFQDLQNNQINWNEIEKKYPKGFNLWWEFEGFLNSNITQQEFLEEDNANGMVYFISYRDLYDFFDEQRIYIFPLRTEYHQKGMGFGYEIQHEARYRQYGFKSRKKAEEQAFLKAFEILEK